MGTHNLTVVILGGEPRIAQYGQWDGYPKGQGATALNFLLTADLEAFKANVLKCRFFTKYKKGEIKKFLKSIGCENGWMNGDQAAKYHEKYPFLTRDNGAGILNLIYESKNRINWLGNEYEFAGDSLFCEWAYVIDLDKRTFEVYEGFNSKPLEETERFYHLTEKMESDSKYYPVRMIKSYSLDELPTEKDFLEEMEKIREAENAENGEE